MQIYRCPSCGADVTFQSPISVTCVCSFCHSLIVRRDKDIEAMGKMAELPDDISPFQIGTNGLYHQVHFSLIGRVRMAWEDGGWNEWFLWLDDGKKAWLAEAQGALAISFESELPSQAGWLHKPLQLGHEISVASEVFMISDLKTSQCLTCEGELPSVIKQGQKSFTVDAVSKTGKFVSFSCDELWHPQELFIGTYVEFNALSFTHLRELPGWKSTPSSTQPTEKKA